MNDSGFVTVLSILIAIAGALFMVSVTYPLLTPIFGVAAFPIHLAMCFAWGWKSLAMARIIVGSDDA